MRFGSFSGSAAGADPADAADAAGGAGDRDAVVEDAGGAAFLPKSLSRKPMCVPRAVRSLPARQRIALLYEIVALPLVVLRDHALDLRLRRRLGFGLTFHQIRVRGEELEAVALEG